MEHEGSVAALKLQQPPCAWEFVVLRVLHERCPPASRCLFGRALRLYNMPASTGLLLSLGRHGTLQDLVNAHLRAKTVRLLLCASQAFKHRQQAVSEVAVAWFAAELCRIGAALASCRVMHSDIKVRRRTSLVPPLVYIPSQPDNLLIRWDPASTTAHWDPLEGSNWQHAGLQLIDFGRAVDLDRLPLDTSFVVRINLYRHDDAMTPTCRATRRLPSTGARRWTSRHPGPPSRHEQCCHRKVCNTR